MGKLGGEAAVRAARGNTTKSSPAWDSREMRPSSGFVQEEPAVMEVIVVVAGEK